MNTLLTVLSLWMHAAATILLIGHYLLIGLAYLPAVRLQFETRVVIETLNHLFVRTRPWINLSLLIFLLTGGYLTIFDSNYPGFGNLFANGWTLLMVVKHILVIGFIVIGFMVGSTLSKSLASSENLAASSGTLQRASRYISINNLLGLLILLLTAIAQAL